MLLPWISGCKLLCLLCFGSQQQVRSLSADLLVEEMENDSKLCDAYKVSMRELVTKGYARNVPTVQINPVEGNI